MIAEFRSWLAQCDFFYITPKFCVFSLMSVTTEHTINICFRYSRYCGEVEAKVT